MVADDASTDGSVVDALRRFSQIRLYRHEQRQGVSATKALGGRHARGEVLVFLDAHTKAEHGAIIRLVEDVEETAGHAIITPAVPALDVQEWQNNFAQVGNGYTLNLQTFDCGWKSLGELRGAQERRGLYESPALIGCALAISRSLYETLWGFDSHMRSWGVEDLDFGLKCWLMGYRILHDPDAVIGHRFRASFDNFSVPMEHVLINQLRMARKNFTDSVWAEWLEGWRQRHSRRWGGYWEGLWAHAWLLFNDDRPSVEQERSYLHAQRSRDEFWYAERFGLSWPRLPAVGAVPPLVFAGAAQSRVTGITPAAPTIFLGQSQKFTAEGTDLDGVLWSAPSATPAYGSGPMFTTTWTASGAFTVTASCGSTSVSASVVVVAVTSVLTPDDNFTGRSKTNFGVGELIHLSFVSTPPRTAAQLGGLRWYIASGRGRLTGTGANNGRGDYTAPAAFGAVQLQLKVVSGPNVGELVARSDIIIVEPNDAVMGQEPDTSIRHVTGLWGVGFYGVPFLRPIDVSFARILFGEGAASSMASGFLASFDSLVHQASPLFTVGRGDRARGCQVNAFDIVNMGDLPGPFSTGDFDWAIPWEFSADGSCRVAFITADLHATADAAGTAVISKKGAGPFTRLVGDPTAPALTAIEPSSGPSSGGTKVTITGRGLSDTSVVMFGATPALSLAVVNDTLISAVSPAASGVVEVVIWFPHFPPTPVVPAGRFTFIPPPVITNASPEGPAAIGTLVKSTGANFASASLSTIGVVAKVTIREGNMDYEQAVRALEPLRYSEDLRAVQTEIEALLLQLSTACLDEYLRFMIYVCEMLTSHDFRDYPRQILLVDEYATSALERTPETRLERELLLLSFLQGDIESGASEADWPNIRRERATRWFRALKRLDNQIDKTFDFDDLPWLSEAPPPGANLPPGIAPDHIRDAALRREYEARIENNRKKADTYTTQWKLRQVLEEYTPRADEYVSRAYAQPPYAVTELQQILAEDVLDNARRAAIISVVENDIAVGRWL